jgi:hypothetical protein
MSPQLIVNWRALNEDPATSLAVVIEKGVTLMDKHLKGPQERVLSTDRLTGGLIIEDDGRGYKE